MYSTDTQNTFQRKLYNIKYILKNFEKVFDEKFFKMDSFFY